MWRNGSYLCRGQRRLFFPLTANAGSVFSPMPKVWSAESPVAIIGIHHSLPACILQSLFVNYVRAVYIPVNPNYQDALTSTCPSSSKTFPRSHSRPSPLLDHVTSSICPSVSPAPAFAPVKAVLFFHRFTVSSLNPACRSLSSPFCFQRARSRSASRASSQSSSSVISPGTGRRVDLHPECRSSSSR